MLNFNKNRREENDQENMYVSKFTFPKPPKFGKTISTGEEDSKISLKWAKSQFKSKSETINLININSTSSQQEVPDKGLFYKDVAIFRFLDNKAQVFSDSNFLNIFYKRPNSPYWKTLDYVQTNIKSRVGIGRPIFIKFYADLKSK